MKSFNVKSIMLLFTLICVFLPGCSDEELEIPMVDSGSWYETQNKWPHDGHPFESTNFMVYSDASNYESKQLVALICEEGFEFIQQKLGMTDLSILKFPSDRNNKIHIYAYKNHFPQSWGGQAYYGGFMIYAPDHPERTKLGYTQLDKYTPIMRHELMHAVQTLILGNNDESYLYNWFAEGIAIEISDDNFYSKIETKAKLDSLYFTFGKRNPVAIRHSWETPMDIENIGVMYWYPMYWLAVRYLVDPQGLGGSFHDVFQVLLDGTNGQTFDTSLKTRFGISQSEFEAQFFGLMENYLP